MIGYYVHHEGRGHLDRAILVAARSRRRVAGISSLPRPPAWRGDWIDIPRDDDGPVVSPTRNGAWHWGPRGHRGFGRRMLMIAEWIAKERPSAVVSDVSVEVLVLAALLGTRTAAVLLHGERDDPAHRLGLATADLILAPWPSSHRRDWHARLTSPLVTTGGFGRYDDRAAQERPPEPRVLVLAGAGPHALDPNDIVSAAVSAPRWRWDVVGLGAQGPAPVRWHGWREDSWDLLESATVVVATAGSGVVAEIAAARRPAILLPQTRPFDEQACLAEAVARLCPARSIARWPEPGRWPALLQAVARLDGAGWAHHVDGRGAARFVDAIEALAA